MQFRLLSAFFIFLGSYLPLAIILAIQDIPKEWWTLPICFINASPSECSFQPFKNPALALAFLGVNLASVAMSYATLRQLSYPFSIEVVTAKSIPNDIINYVFPYVVSFMGISYSEPEKLLGFVVFLLWMFAITYKSGQIIMNPLLLMFGWRLYEATITVAGHTREVRIMKKDVLVPGPYNAQTVQDFYICEG